MSDSPQRLPGIEALGPRIIGGRFELLEPLGQGGQGVTFRARDRHADRAVVVKELAISGLDDWKTLELFEREATLLNTIDHPRVPRFVDAIALDDSAGSPRRFIVRDFVPGESLREMIERGRRFTERDALEIARQLLDLLAFLHALDPPVIHRDVKPSNLILDDVGRVHLVDFGVAQASRPESHSGSTIVGTAGFLPPEQLSGASCPGSDLYALGATLVYMLSARHPAHLPVARLRLQFRAATAVSDTLARFLDLLLAPDVAHRPDSAREAIRWLEEYGLLSSDRLMAGALGMESHAITVLNARSLPPLPRGSRLRVSHSRAELTVDLPVRWRALWPQALSILAGLALLLVGTSLASGFPGVAAMIALAGIASLGFGVPRFAPRRLTLTRRELIIEWRWSLQRVFRLPLKDVFGLCVDDRHRRASRDRRHDQTGGFSLVGARDERDSLAIVWREPELKPLDILNPIKIRRVNDRLSIMERRWLIEVFGRWEHDDVY